MDERFDRISRLLGSGTTRRALVAAAVGVASLDLSGAIAKRHKRGRKQRGGATHKLRAESQPEVVTINTTRQGVSGTFTASGGISDEGTFRVQSAHFGGAEASLIRIVQATEEFVGLEGTFTLKRQIRITPTSNPVLRAVEGTWVVLGGTGEYADLHAQGKVIGTIQGTDPPTEKFLFVYTGKAHYD